MNHSLYRQAVFFVVVVLDEPKLDLSLLANPKHSGFGLLQLAVVPVVAVKDDLVSELQIQPVLASTKTND